MCSERVNEPLGSASTHSYAHTAWIFRWSHGKGISALFSMTDVATCTLTLHAAVKLSSMTCISPTLAGWIRSTLNSPTLQFDATV